MKAAVRLSSAPPSPLPEGERETDLKGRWRSLARGRWKLAFDFFRTPHPWPYSPVGRGRRISKGQLAAWALGMLLALVGLRPLNPGPLPGGEREQEEEYRLAAESSVLRATRPNVMGLCMLCPAITSTLHRSVRRSGRRVPSSVRGSRTLGR